MIGGIIWACPNSHAAVILMPIKRPGLSTTATCTSARSGRVSAIPTPRRSGIGAAASIRDPSLAGFDDIAELESPRPEIRFLCWYHRVLDAFVEHEKSPNIVNEIGSQAWLADVLVHINEHAIRGWMSFCPGTDDANLSP
jgi:hypothetical protein